MQYSTAKKMNEGKIPFVAHKTSHIIAFIIIGIVIVIIYFIVLMAIMTTDDGNEWIILPIHTDFFVFWLFRQIKKSNTKSTVKILSV